MVDVVGYIPMSRRKELFFQLVSSRSERASMIVLSNRSAAGDEVAADEVGAATMIDRLVHHAEVGRSPRTGFVT